MKNKYRNLFLLFGVLAIVVMLLHDGYGLFRYMGESEARGLLVSCDHAVVVLCLSDKYLFVVSDNQG